MMVHVHAAMKLRLRKKSKTISCCASVQKYKMHDVGHANFYFIGKYFRGWDSSFDALLFSHRYYSDSEQN